MSMYSTFKTDATLEVEGVWTDYGPFQVKIAHAGGSNKQFLSVGEIKTKPLRRAIETGSAPRERLEQMMFEIYAETIVKGWRTLVDGELKDGIEGPDGELLPFSKDNVLATFKNLPALFYDVKEVAESIAAYRHVDLEGDAKN